MATAPETLFDSTWGGATANAYVGLVDAGAVPGADSIIRVNLEDAAPWELAGAEQKQRAILSATRLIDAQNWKGTRATEAQRLEFPREVTESDARQQVDLRLATCLQALYLLARPFDRSRDDQYRGIRGASMGGGRLSQSSSYGDVHMDLAPDVWDIMSLYRGAVRIVRG